MANWLSSMLQGVSEASNQWPQAMQARQQFQQQAQARQAAEVEAKRNRLLEMFKLAVTTESDPRPIAMAMKQSGLFPEMDGMMGPGVPTVGSSPVGPVGPRIAPPTATFKSMVPERLMGMRPDRLYSSRTRYIVLLLIPVGMVASIPTRIIVDPLDSWPLPLLLLITTTSVLLTNRFWRWGIKRYMMTG